MGEKERDMRRNGNSDTDTDIDRIGFRNGFGLRRLSRRARVALGTCVAVASLATVAGVAIASPATAGAPAATRHSAAAAPVPTTVRSGSADSATDRVADFYGAYIDAVTGDTGPLSTDLRNAYLTKALRTKLAAWEAEQHADGVLRAQDVPVKWSVAGAGSATGHVTSTVTLTWGYGPHPEVTKLTVTSDTATHLITAIAPAS